MNGNWRDNSEASKVWETVTALNRLWTEEKQPESLTRFFHPDMIAVCAGETGRREGQAECVAGWKAFCDHAADIRVDASNPTVQLLLDGRAAVVVYNYTCTFTADGERKELSGRDMYVMVKEGGRWLAAADHFSCF